MPDDERSERTSFARAFSIRLLWLCLVVALFAGAFLAYREITASDPRSEPASAGTVRVGSPGRRRALWVLGRASLRFDADGGDPRLLAQQGFGSVLGANGRVDLFDPPSGQVGSIDARHNRLVDLGRVVTDIAPATIAEPALADTGTNLWLATGPGQVTRFALASRATTAVTVATDATTTRVTAIGPSVFAVSTEPDRSRNHITRLNGTTADIEASADVPSTVAGLPLRITTITATAADVWIVGATGAVVVDPVSMRVTASFAYSDPRVVLVAAAVADDGIWGLDRSTGALVRIDRRGVVGARIPTRDDAALLRSGMAVTAGAGGVWAMVPQSPAEPLGAKRITRVDPTTGRTTRRVEIPASLEAGALAISRG